MRRSGGRAALAVAIVAVLGQACQSRQPESGNEKPPPAASERPLVEASRGLLARDLPGLSLGLSLQEVLRQRPLLQRHAEGDREGLKLFQEPLASDRSALYFFDGEGSAIGRLRRVQLASHVKSLEAVLARVQDRQVALGPAGGVWDCPALSGQLPSRRYSYRRGAASALEVYVMVGEQTAITYYVGATREIGASLQRAGCVPTPPERAARFPVAVP